MAMMLAGNIEISHRKQQQPAGLLDYRFGTIRDDLDTLAI